MPGIIGVGIVGIVRDDPWCALCVSSMIKPNIILPRNCCADFMGDMACIYICTYAHAARLQTLPYFYQHLLTRVRGAGFERQLHARWVRDKIGVWTMRAERKA